MRPLIKLAIAGVLLATLMALAAVAGTRAAGAPHPGPRPFVAPATERVVPS